MSGRYDARAVPEPRPFVIAHLSDLHCGSPYFVENLLQRAIMERASTCTVAYRLKDPLKPQQVAAVVQP